VGVGVDTEPEAERPGPGRRGPGGQVGGGPASGSGCGPGPGGPVLWRGCRRPPCRCRVPQVSPGAAGTCGRRRSGAGGR